MIDEEHIKKQWFITRKCENGYTRIDTQHPLEWYIGYDHELNYSLRVISGFFSKTISSSKVVSIKQKQRQDANWVLEISLLNEDEVSVFFDMCYSLLKYSQTGQNGQDAFERFQSRYYEWEKLLERAPSGIMSLEKQRGLIGELLFLNRQIKKTNQVHLALDGWRGPYGSHQDFLYNDTWYEIKTVMDAAKSVKISSLQQLALNGNGRLVLYRLYETAKTDVFAFSLNQVVRQVKKLCSNDIDVKTKLSEALCSVGYMECFAYDEYKYKIQDVSVYQVNETFPRLAPQFLPEAIVAVSYELAIAALASWKVREE